MAWVLSFETSKRHYDETMLVTDQEGARLLVDGLGLEFTSVLVDLEALRDSNPDWWILGKLWTYRLQDKPFVHIDSDVFLWRALPEAFKTASVFAQNPERFSFANQVWYRPSYYDEALRSGNGWVPEEWRSYIANRAESAVCCGFLGGTAVEFLRYYADLAIRMIQHEKNQCIWDSLEILNAGSVLLEQYFLAACLDFQSVEIKYLFTSLEEAFDVEATRRAGYTHLIAGSKKNARLAQRLEARVREDYPGYYERCLRLS